MNRWTKATVSSTTLMALLACGSSSDSDDGAADDAPTETAAPDAAAPETGAPDTEASADDAAGDVSDAPPAQEVQLPADGRYGVGDGVVARDFEVTYLGLAAVPVTGAIWADGVCYSPLFSVTNRNTIDDRYQTGIPRGWFVGGDSTDGGNTEDGCTLSLIEQSGYQSEFDLIGPDATANVYGTAIYVPAAAVGTLDLVTIDNSTPDEGGLDPEITLDLTAG